MLWKHMIHSADETIHYVPLTMYTISSYSFLSIVPTRFCQHYLFGIRKTNLLKHVPYHKQHTNRVSTAFFIIIVFFLLDPLIQLAKFNGINSHRFHISQRPTRVFLTLHFNRGLCKCVTSDFR